MIYCKKCFIVRVLEDEIEIERVTFAKNKLFVNHNGEVHYMLWEVLDTIDNRIHQMYVFDQGNTRAPQSIPACEMWETVIEIE